MTLETISEARAFEGTQGVYRHQAVSTNCEMTFAVFVPPQAKTQICPALFYLSGLTCTHQNVLDKGEYRRMAAELGIIIVCPDTSPRGEDVADDPDDWQLGKGAGFYLDATEAPWASHYQMQTYVRDELYDLMLANFPIDPARIGVFGHSMGGHGALTLALKNPDKFKSCSAFAPIVNPSSCDWSTKGLSAYLGDNPQAWRPYDAVQLIEDGARYDALLVDQGEADGFLEDGLKPWLLRDACEKAGIGLTLNMRDGYDHSYYFISSFMDDHLRWHAARLGA